MHLNPEEFIDVAEGTRTEASLPHLSDCGRCRGELADLRRAMAVAVDVDVPEPSPLFWNTLSARIGERIDAEAGRSWWRALTRPSILVPASALALLVLVVALVPNARSGRLVSPAGPGPTSAAASIADVDSGADAVELSADPLLTLVSDLSANMDLDGVSAAGFAEPDSAEHAVTHMTTDELAALKHLLQAEMTRSGAPSGASSGA